MARRRHPRGRHLRGAARGRRPVRRRPAGADALAPVRRPTSTPSTGRPGDPHRQPARRPRGAARRAQPGARFVLERLTTHAAARPRAPRELWRARRRLRRSTGGPARGRRAAPAAGPRRPTSPRSSRLLTDVVGAGLAPTTVWVSHLTDDRARLAAHGVRRLHDPAAHRHRPVARRPRRAAGDAPPCSTCTRSSAATRSATAAAPRRRPATCWSSAAAPPTASASRRRPATRRCADRAATVARGGLDAAGFVRSPFCDRRQAAAVRRAAAHAGLDAVPARGRRGARRSATRSTCGSATPRRRSTGSSSPESRIASAARTGSCSGHQMSRATIATR